MKTKTVFLLVASLVVFCLPLYASGTKEPVEVSTAGGEPQYGGTLTVFSGVATADPESPDINDGYWRPLFFLSPFIDRPFVGDFVKYGPRGTGQNDFQLRGYTPEEFMTGNLLESWEVGSDKLIWHIRKGVYWHGNNPKVMKSREFTAADMVARLLYFREAPGGKGFKKMSAGIYTTDKYTLAIEFGEAGFNSQMQYVIGWEDRALVEPPETRAAGADKWENQVGTGPFMFKEYVFGSHFEYEKNPNYWKKATINGKEYDLPFADKMILPIMPDESVQIAALRTAKIDFSERVEPHQWATLDRTSPELVSKKSPAAGGYQLSLNCKKPPFDNVDVRRAMMIATDMAAFREILGAPEVDLPVDWWPVYFKTSSYTPMAELPEEDQLLFKYNPELAKKMLADAGYPDGFETTINCFVDPASQDRAALVKSQWAKVGVIAKIDAVDPAVISERRYNVDFDGVITAISTRPAYPAGNMVRGGKTGGVTNYAGFSNEAFDKLCDGIEKETDYKKRSVLVKKAAQIMTHEVPYIGAQPSLVGHYWWPWLKNYYGERNVQDHTGFTHILAQVWIDQDLKAKMGH